MNGEVAIIEVVKEWRNERTRKERRKGTRREASKGASFLSINSGKLSTIILSGYLVTYNTYP